MRLAVDEVGYSSAVESLVSGNALAARAATGLAGRLRGCAAMAGDDSTATDFATSYDDAAVASVVALESVVGAFGALGRLVEASLANHAGADARSTLPGWARAVTGPPSVADRAVGVRLAAPPSSLGAHSGGPGGLSGVVLDALQDVFWPNADTGRVRAAGRSWASAAVSVGLLGAHCDSALSALEGERSPEIPVAVVVIRDVRDRVDDLSAQLEALGSACTDYAEHVDTKRDELLSLLEDLAVELGVTALLGGLGTVLSGGAAGGIATGVGASRLAAAGARARGILASLRGLTGGTAVSVRPVAVSAGEIGARAERINGARVMLTEASGQGAARRPDLPFGHLRPNWLQAHEITHGHTMNKHVGKSLSQLRKRLGDEPNRAAVSSFSTRAEAERALEQAFSAREAAVQRWLDSASQKMAFSAEIGRDVGSILIRETGRVVSSTKVRFVLIKDPSMPGGWRLLTGYPDL